MFSTVPDQNIWKTSVSTGSRHSFSLLPWGRREHWKYLCIKEICFLNRSETELSGWSRPKTGHVLTQNDFRQSLSVHDIATSLTYNRKINTLYGKERNRGLHFFIQLYGIHHLPTPHPPPKGFPPIYVQPVKSVQHNKLLC